VEIGALVVNTVVTIENAGSVPLSLALDSGIRAYSRAEWEHRWPRKGQRRPEGHGRRIGVPRQLEPGKAIRLVWRGDTGELPGGGTRWIEVSPA